jgi:hypothetical protein
VSGEGISPALERALRALAQAIAAAIWDQEIELPARAQGPDLSSDGERDDAELPKSG